MRGAKVMDVLRQQSHTGHWSFLSAGKEACVAESILPESKSLAPPWPIRGLGKEKGRDINLPDHRIWSWGSV